MASEFDLIRRHFTRPCPHTDLAGGDDAALLSPRPGMQLVVSTDMLVEGTHFLPGTPPEDLGWKALAVNLSDLAAMGAEARWAVLALALPAADEAWIAAFARGFFACAESFAVDVAGGDTTRGALNLCPTVFGDVPQGQAIRRDGAQPGDELWVSGQPGRAALGLAHLQGRTVLPPAAVAACLAALHRPQPRLALGQALRGLATAMLDVSDGLLGDLGHILEQSRVGALVEEARLPLEPLLAHGTDPALARHCLLAGGDDYELLFTAPAARRAEVLALASQLALPLHPIGHITPEAGRLQMQGPGGRAVDVPAAGFDHFA